MYMYYYCHVVLPSPSFNFKNLWCRLTAMPSFDTNHHFSRLHPSTINNGQALLYSFPPLLTFTTTHDGIPIANHSSLAAPSTTSSIFVLSHLSVFIRWKEFPERLSSSTLRGSSLEQYGSTPTVSIGPTHYFLAAVEKRRHSPTFARPIALCDKCHAHAGTRTKKETMDL